MRAFGGSDLRGPLIRHSLGPSGASGGVLFAVPSVPRSRTSLRRARWLTSGWSPWVRGCLALMARRTKCHGIRAQRGDRSRPICTALHASGTVDTGRQHAAFIAGAPNHALTISRSAPSAKSATAANLRLERVSGSTGSTPNRAKGFHKTTTYQIALEVCASSRFTLGTPRIKTEGVRDAKNSGLIAGGPAIRRGSIAAKQEMRTQWSVRH